MYCNLGLTCRETLPLNRFLKSREPVPLKQPGTYTGTYLHGGEDEEEGEVDADDGVEAGGGEEVGEMAEEDGNEGGEEGGEQEPDDLAAQADLHPHHRRAVK